MNIAHPPWASMAGVEPPQRYRVASFAPSRSRLPSRVFSLPSHLVFSFAPSLGSNELMLCPLLSFLHCPLAGGTRSKERAKEERMREAAKNTGRAHACLPLPARVYAQVFQAIGTLAMNVELANSLFRVFNRCEL